MQNAEMEAAILSLFEDIISRYDFKLINNQKVRGEIQLYSKVCTISFIYDYGYIECAFVDPKEKLLKEGVKRADGLPSGYPVYPVYAVWTFLYPNDKINFKYDKTDVERQLLAIKNLLNARLANVLHGDFSWTNAFKINDRSKSTKIEYMFDHWENDNPVIIKFNNGDPEWEKAFDEYKTYLDGLQTRST